MILLDHLLAIFLVVIGPLRGGVAFTRLRDARPEELPAARRAAYRSAVLTQWLRVLATACVWWATRRPLGELGLVPRFGWGLGGVLVGLAVIVVLMARQRARAIADAEGRADIRAHLANMRVLLPHTRAEFGAFAGVAITAGLCEELLYRGYLVWYFSHALPWWAAGLVAALAFGLGHTYQGVRGVAVTTLLGAFLAAVYFVSGSLYAPMLIHALMDLHTGDLAARVYAREREDLATPVADDAETSGRAT
jgi:membrane protease YdiL (CAAX protease family)